MTLPNDCPCGRSQLFTFDAGDDSITIDRRTLAEISWALGLCFDNLREIELQQEFVSVASKFLQDYQQEGLQVEKALLFLDCWLSKVPDCLGIASRRLLETHEVLSSILAASKMGSSHD